jgi:hypothetical protein
MTPMTLTAKNSRIDFETWLGAISQEFTSKMVQPPIVSKKRQRRRVPPELNSRGLDRRRAAELVGLSPSGYDQARREGKYPGPTLPGKKYDRKLIEQAMNRWSGLDEKQTPASALDRWRTRGSRSH